MIKAKLTAGTAAVFALAAITACTSGGGTVAANPQPAALAGGPREAAACERLADLKMDGVRISSATTVAENALVQNSELNPTDGPMTEVARRLPSFCRVVGHIHPEAGSDIGFEVWMPSADWNGRLHGVGIGGFAGGIDYLTLGLALKGGAVGVATDTGHSGTVLQSGWAKGHPELVRDYGWRAIHLSNVAAKKLIAGFYGRGPDKSYFVGCSGGGRQGLMEAARFPEDYDGIVSGAPAANFTDLAIAMINPIQAQMAPGAAIRPEQIPLLQDEVLKQCDAIDGQTDGLVEDPRQCRFDAAKLACGTSNSPQCFSAPQILALKKIHAGAFDSRGRQLAAGYPPSGSEIGNPSPQSGWEGYLLGKSIDSVISGGLLDDFVPARIATVETFDFDKDPARLKAALSQDLDAPADLRRFFARGGKLILWHGWGDAAIPPEHTLRYHDALLRSSGPRAGQNVRLFMVPGVQHCLGGTGPDSFGQLSAPKRGEDPRRSMAAALQSWVEGGAAPEEFVARRGHGGLRDMPEVTPERQRLLCSWPRRAVLRSGANPDEAASYTCK